MPAITLNGQTHALPRPAILLEELITTLGLEARTLLIEHNGQALTRTEWKDRSVTDGDRLEILRIAAGG